MTKLATIVATAILASFAAPTLTAQGQTFQWANAIELRFVEKFHEQWNDSGSGAGRDGAFWNPEAPKGFHIVGSMGRNQYHAPGSNDIAVVVRDISADKTALAEPTGYELVWADHGSGAHQDGSFWKPKAPAGYVAMGLYCQKGYREPSKNAMRCVRRDLVEFGTVGTQIWNDSGSGADRDFAAWTIKPSTAHPGFAYISANTFVGHASHHAMGGGTECYVFQISVAEPHKEDVPPRPVLHGTTKPSPYASDNTVNSRVELPWFAVNDRHMNAAQRIAKSPVYTLVRQDRYKLIYHTFNDSNSTQQPSVSYTEGFSETDTKSFSNTTGISVTGSFNALGSKMSVTLSHSFTFGSSTSRTNQHSRTVTYPMTVSSGTAAAVYTIESTYQLFRKDGTKVGMPLVGSAPMSLYYTSWPSADELAQPGK